MKNEQTFRCYSCEQQHPVSVQVECCGCAQDICATCSEKLSCACDLLKAAPATKVLQ